MELPRHAPWRARGRRRRLDERLAMLPRAWWSWGMGAHQDSRCSRVAYFWPASITTQRCRNLSRPARADPALERRYMTTTQRTHLRRSGTPPPRSRRIQMDSYVCRSVRLVISTDPGHTHTAACPEFDSRRLVPRRALDGKPLQSTKICSSLTMAPQPPIRRSFPPSAKGIREDHRGLRPSSSHLDRYVIFIFAVRSARSLRPRNVGHRRIRETSLGRSRLAGRDFRRWELRQIGVCDLDVVDRSVRPVGDVDSCLVLEGHGGDVAFANVQADSLERGPGGDLRGLLSLLISNAAAIRDHSKQRRGRSDDRADPNRHRSPFKVHVAPPASYCRQTMPSAGKSARTPRRRTDRQPHRPTQRHSCQ